MLLRITPNDGVCAVYSMAHTHCYGLVLSYLFFSKYKLYKFTIMLEKKFTPGTWEQSHRKKRNGMYSTEVYDKDSKETIATIAWYAMPPQRELVEGEYKIVTHTYREANARLISAAPELFNALEELLAQVKQFTQGNIGEQDYFRDEISNAKKALDKAVGSDSF